MAGEHFGAVVRQMHRVYHERAYADYCDAVLLERFVSSRDEAAFTTLVERHGSMVLSVCKGVLKDTSEAQDAFQATFLVLVRKSASLRVEGSLGGWLHRVAFRMALQANEDLARRRVVERRAVEQGPSSGGDSNPALDDLPVLHEELDRLPEKYRAPIVLCHLEQMSHAQAAEHLGWSVGSIRGRVARGRHLLRTRLVRRGFALAGGLLVDSGSAEAATVPDSWIDATVRAASSLAAGQGVATASTALALSERVAAALVVSRLKPALAIILSISVTVGAATGLLAWTGQLEGQDVSPLSQPSTQTSSKGPAAHGATPPASLEASITLTGTVVDPDGRPVDRALVRVIFDRPPGVESPDLRTSTGPDGRFTLQASRSAFEAPGPPPSLTATAEGFGPASAGLGSRSDAGRGVTLRLSADDVPIEGRIVDLEGRPVAGAQITTETLWIPAGPLSAWLDQVARGNVQSPWQGGFEGLAFATKGVTGPDGRFVVKGAGRDRLVALTVSGPTIETTSFWAATRLGDDVRSKPQLRSTEKGTLYHDARVELAVPPTKPIAGVVRDRDTDRPLPGVRIRGHAYEGFEGHVPAGPTTTSDSEGRYRLTGLPKAAEYRLMASAPDGHPYPDAYLKVPGDTPGLDVKTFDFAMKRGIQIRGRLIDKATGRPVIGRVEAFAFLDNPHLKDFPDYAQTDSGTWTKPDGRFELRALPGRGLLAAGSYSGGYLKGVGADRIEGRVLRNGQGPEVFPALPRDCVINTYEVLAEFDSKPGDTSITRDLQLDPGRTRSGTVVDPDSRPVTGTLAEGLASETSWDTTPRDSAQFQVVGLEPGKPRRIVFSHPGRKLAGTALVSDIAEGPISVQLQPWGSIRGRIVDDGGEPRTKVFLIGRYLSSNPGPDDGRFPNDIPVDRDGRFQVEGLVPGLAYEGRVAAQGGRILGSAFKGLRIAPGESKDLGDLKPVLEGSE